MHRETVLGIIAHRVRNFSSRDYLVLGSEQDEVAKYIDNPGSCESVELRRMLASRSYVESVTKEILRWEKERGVFVITILNKEYPPLLRRCFDPPIVLFGKGRREALERLVEVSHVAIVGSRRSEPSSEIFAKALGKELRSNNICVVSGLASGIDAFAHEGALSGVGDKPPTIAVLGHGLGSIYPSRNEKLAERIIENNGILLSEYEPEVTPRPNYFLMRNRIIAGISCAVVVVQAAKKSGSLVTARSALEEGREVFVVPGSIRDERYQGSNELLKQGARVLTTVDDIFENLSIKKSDVTKRVVQSALSTIEDKICEIIQRKNGAYLHEIKSSINDITYESLLQKLNELEMNGAVTIQPGDFVIMG